MGRGPVGLDSPDPLESSPDFLVPGKVRLAEKEPEELELLLVLAGPPVRLLNGLTGEPKSGKVLVSGLFSSRLSAMSIRLERPGTGL